MAPQSHDRRSICVRRLSAWVPDWPQTAVVATKLRLPVCRSLRSGPCPAIRSGPRSSTRRAPPTPSAASCSRSWRGRSRSPRARAGATPTATPTLATAVAEGARRTRCPRTTSSGRSTAAPARAPTRRAIERVVYEGYGPGGAAILVEALTDNRNRTSAEVRHAFDQARRQPRRAGLGRLDLREARRDPGRRRALRRGRPDRRDRRRRRGRRARTATCCKVLCEPGDLAAVREALEEAGVEIESAELAMEPKSTVEVEEGEAEGAARPDRRARRARRRRRGPRQLRHPRGGAGARSRPEPARDACPGRHPRPRRQNQYPCKS